MRFETATADRYRTLKRLSKSQLETNCYAHCFRDTWATNLLSNNVRLEDRASASMLPGSNSGKIVLTEADSRPRTSA